MIIKWLDAAVYDLQHLRSYIANSNSGAAKNIAKRILTAVNLLAEQPGIGRAGRVSNTRELVISGTPYVVPYHVKANTVEILRVLHTAMQWPEKL